MAGRSTHRRDRCRLQPSAFGTIIDSHLTTLIAAIALFCARLRARSAASPSRSSIGIVTTLFTAYLVTRLIVSIWVRRARPKDVPL